MFNLPQDRGMGSRSIQPYFVLSTASAYAKKVLVDSPISHFYSFVADKSGGQAFAVPDGCVDVLFLCDEAGPKGRVCGSTVTAKLVELQTNKRYFGVRFRPGCIPDFIPMGARDLVGAEVALQDLDPQGSTLMSQITEAACFNAQVGYFMQQYGARLARPHSSLCDQVSELILAHHGDIRIHEL
ncbi:MAG: hypothetical protein KA214_07175, partial [Neisseriaceae bacterium]|nr:hypothetical protein [Neisseriaceae bacterium]